MTEKNQNNPLVTIITPLYNAKNYFEETFKSVINQTFQDFEWIIVDDISTDGSFELAEKLAKTDSRIKLFKVDEKGGPAKARNKALTIASGQYISFLDSDDLLDENFLEEQTNFMKENGPIITSSYRRLAPSSVTDFIVPETTDYKKLLNGNPLSCLTTMYDRSAIGEAYFPEDLKKAEDYVFWLKILKRGFVAKGNQKVLATYRILQHSRSSNKREQIQIMYDIYHRIMKLNCFASLYHVIRWAFYGVRKYRNVK